jgi:L-ascorbate metabolism protein UlaG (beta-lactamase superfamily)
MKKVKKILKIMVIIIVSTIVSLGIIGVLFVTISPQFGASSSKEKIESYKKEGNFKDGKFVNQSVTNMDMSVSQMFGTLIDFIKGVPNREPNFEIPIHKVDSLTIAKNRDSTKLIWFGHSTFLLQMEVQNILIDPMFGDVPAPHPWLGNKRYSKELPIEIEKLTQIDAVLISHDHYDHLDYGSIQKLKDKTNKFYVPLGVAAHLISWGVDSKKIQELNWWDETQQNGIQLVFTPARHFSGRGFTDRWRTLWGSWVIKGKKENIFFSGDSGYDSHFKEIGEKYGPFDFAMIECGQYNEKWEAIHMMPEQSAQAGKDLQANVMMPIHWGAFSLALHTWTDPVERVTKAAAALNMPLITPKIGEIFSLEDKAKYHHKWWEK